MTASKFIITASAVSTLLLSVSSTTTATTPSISSIVASSRSGMFGLNRGNVDFVGGMTQGWNIASTLRGGSTGKKRDMIILRFYFHY